MDFKDIALAVDGKKGAVGQFDAISDLARAVATSVGHQADTCAKDI